ncbi:MAG: ornithine carbamoyltransferase [Candidatus Dormibacteraceae bacterium]
MVGPLVAASVDRLRGADFLDISDLEPAQLRGLVDLAGEIKAGRWQERPLAGRTVAMLFQKPSMRTRVSFQVGVQRLGGDCVSLSDSEIQLGRRETAADVARVLDRYVDGIVARLNRHQDMAELAQFSQKPVVNALTDQSHPCQILADLLTIKETLGRLDETVTVAFVGDGNNVVYSLIEAATLLGFNLTVISPPAYRPPDQVLKGSAGVTVSGDLEAVRNASIVYTDVWTSMGMESEAQARRDQFREYQVTEALMAMAPGARFMHCLPAHRGEEVAAAVIDGPASLVFEQAENRLWAQMALMASVF